MDREAWHAAVHGVTKNWTQLSDWIELKDLWENIKCTNIRIIGVPEEEREKGPKKTFEEIIAENFPNMEKETVNHVQLEQRVPGRINPIRNTPRQVIKLTKIKDKLLKTTREKRQIKHKGKPIMLSADFSTETLQARRQCLKIFKMMKGKNRKPRIPSKTLIQILRRNQKLSRQAKIKRIQHH